MRILSVGIVRASDDSCNNAPASTRVESELNNFPFVMLDPATVLDEKDKWDSVWNDLFLSR